MAKSYLIGVDVGTGSVRAGLFTEEGRMVEHSSMGVKTWCDQGHLEQSTTDIWAAVCSCVQVCSTIDDVYIYCSSTAFQYRMLSPGQTVIPPLFVG